MVLFNKCVAVHGSNQPNFEGKGERERGQGFSFFRFVDRRKYHPFVGL